MRLATDSSTRMSARIVPHQVAIFAVATLTRCNGPIISPAHVQGHSAKMGYRIQPCLRMVWSLDVDGCPHAPPSIDL